MKFCQFVASLYPHILTSFGRFILIFNKTAFIFLGVLIVFAVSSFEFQQVILTLSPMMSGPDLPDLSPLDYHVWGQRWSLITSCNRSQKQFTSLKMCFS